VKRDRRSSAETPDIWTGSSSSASEAGSGETPDIWTAREAASAMSSIERIVERIAYRTRST